MSGPYLALLAAPAALGFATLFNVRRRALAGIAVLAAAAKLVQLLVMEHSHNAPMAAFAAALLVGVFAYTIGPMTGEAPAVYSFAPVIPLVPGVFMIDALRALMRLVSEPADSPDAAALLVDASTNGLTAAAVVVALAIGAAGPMLLLPRLRLPGTT